MRRAKQFADFRRIVLKGGGKSSQQAEIVLERSEQRRRHYLLALHAEPLYREFHDIAWF